MIKKSITGTLCTLVGAVGGYKLHEFNWGLPKISAANLPSNPMRVGEIMKYGYPSMENVRAYGDFVLAYDKRCRNAAWVLEHLTMESVKRNDSVSRQDMHFFEEPSVHPYFKATVHDYRFSGYDRGHLAAAANHRSSEELMKQTFTLANISPQVGVGFNRHCWSKLEMFVRHLTKYYANVYVCTGPLYLPQKEASSGKNFVKYEVIGENNVAVPTHFFKVILCQRPVGDFELQSYVLPNQALPEDVDLRKFLVPVDTIERAAGFLIFDNIRKCEIKRINGQPA